MIRNSMFAAACLAALAAAPAAAQHTPIRVGQPVNGTLAQNDPAMSNRGRFKVYRFEARKGDRLVATLSSRDFDPYLTLARSVGGITEEIESNDDADGPDSRIRFTVPADGGYLLVAQSLEAEGLGGFTLSLHQPPAPTTAQTGEIRLGTPVRGSLAETDAMLDEDESYYDSYRLRAPEGQRLLIEMKSDSFDTFLSFGRMENDSYTAISTNDDGGEGTNSALRVTVPAGGEFIVRANSLGSEATGPYTLTVTERPAPAAEADPRPITAGQEVRGSLEDTDPVMEDESFYDYYTYQGRAGERLTITMESEDFDAFLAFGRLAGTTFEEITTNDDGPDGTGSRIEVTLPSAGTYVIRANSLSGGSTGAYTLRVES
ncbi:MAG TPA: PPC domain-containing protein, partial [Longimicrobium sp.]|nr:PPC domain-containing protein [Longimicrobium sp.]